MQRRTLLLSSAAPLLPLESYANTPAGQAQSSATALAAAMASGRLTSQRLVGECLSRIEAIDRRGPKINSILELNPDARSIARMLDGERRDGKVRGPLHGLPVLLKDNIATGDRMQTTAGSLALVGEPAVADAHLVKRLRSAGAVILGKTNLSEWANIRSTRSTSGWSGRGGLTRNPYALDRNTSGSSAGTGAAIAAGLAPLGVGSETDGSIVSPSSLCGLVGLKPTIGRVSRTGVIPIAHTQDTAGPMTRTVADAALLFAALAGLDVNDTVTAGAPVLGAWNPEATPLTGARIGVARAYFTGYDETDALIEKAIATLRGLGAEVIDPVEFALPNYGDAENIVLLHELKADLPKYLQAFAPHAGVKTLADVIAFNRAHPHSEMPWFRQELFEQAEAFGGLDSPVYLQALAQCARQARTEGLDRVFDQHKLDALIGPTEAPAWLTDPVSGDHVIGASICTPAAVAGYPHLTVPAGLVHGLPVGLSFIGRAWSEWQLLSYGHAFEQATQARRAPTFIRNSQWL